MSVSVGEDLDIDLFTLLTFEVETPCESPDGCDSKAEWHITLGCCGRLILICHNCKVRLCEWIDWAIAEKTLNVKCNLCKTIVEPRKFLFNIERL